MTPPSPFNRTPPDRASGWLRGGFTLVEILAVVAITAVLLLIAANVFNSSEARSGQVARDVVVAQLNLARSHAIATGTPTAVVFSPYEGGPEEKRGRMLGLVEAKEIGGGAHQVTQVLERWEELPSKQIMVSQTLSPGLGATVMDGGQKLNLALGGGTVSAPYLLFSKEGAVIFPQGGRVRIAIGPGTVVDGKPRLTGKNQDGSAAEIIEVSRLSGRIQLLNPLDQ